MILLILAMACAPESATTHAPGEGTPSTPAPTTPAPTTSTDTTDATDTPTEVVPELEGVESVMVRVDVAELRSAIGGQQAGCEDDLAVVAMEFSGQPDQALVTPWLDGEEGTPIDFVVRTGEPLQLVTAESTVASCAEVTWVWEVVQGSEGSCVVTGPDAAQLAADLDCLGG